MPGTGVQNTVPGIVTAHCRKWTSESQTQASVLQVLVGHPRLKRLRSIKLNLHVSIAPHCSAPMDAAMATVRLTSVQVAMYQRSGCA